MSQKLVGSYASVGSNGGIVSAVHEGFVLLFFASSSIVCHKMVHEAELEADPTNGPMIIQLLQAARRAAPPQIHKIPATEAHLRHISEFYKNDKSDKNLRTLLISVMAFAGGMRIDDFLALPIAAVSFAPGDSGEIEMKLDLGKYKTDQFPVGARKVIVSSPYDPDICPVKLMQIWLKRPSSAKSSLLFPMLTCKQDADSPKPIAKTSFADGLRKALKDSNLPHITPHSFRAGFATAAINNGVSVSDIKEFALWESDSSVQRYMRRADSKKAAIGRQVWEKPSE